MNGSTVFKSNAKWNAPSFFPGANRNGDQDFEVKFPINYGGNKIDYYVRDHHNTVDYWSGGY